ncbi:MAG: family 1 glycosylhydrolase [Candidatus Babeliales bacterium]
MKLSITINKSLLFLSLFIVSTLPARDAWDWKNIDTSTVVFDTNKMLFGVALAEYQNSGATNLPNSNWAHWEKQPGAIENGQTSGVACDFWHLYKTDINLMKDLGCNSCRLSIDWSAIEPQEGKFDESAVQHYHDVIDSMLAKGITPMVTLHHFVHPQWFEAMGAFEKQENLKFFVRFCVFVFSKFSSKVHLWCPINESGPLAFQSYIIGHFPPTLGYTHLGFKFSFGTAGQVLGNLMKAHVLVYNALKQMPNGDKAQIGFNHQYLNFEGYNVWDKPIATVFRYTFNTVILEFLKTGIFRYDAYGFKATRIIYKDILSCIDFIGLNYYSEVIIRGGDARCYDHEVMTDMQYAIYAEGFYAAIKDLSQFKKPIYITENGIGDAKDDRRETFIKRYLYAMSRAMHDFNADIKGYYYWSLMDNFEWEHGRLHKFGLYEVNFDTLTRTLRPGAACIKQFFKPLPA